MEALKLANIANQIAGKAEIERGDDSRSVIAKIKAIMRQLESLSKLEKIPEGDLVRYIQSRIGFLIEYGLIMFVLQNILSSELSEIFKPIITKVFNSVMDGRDHRFRYGKCNCPSCR